MRRLIPFLMMLTIALTGCGSEKKTANDTAMASYEGYYKAVSDNVSFQNGSDYFDISGQMTKMSDGTYRYYIFIDNPQVAMYNIAAIAVEDDIPYGDIDKMMPNIGIFDDTHISMIPFQSNPSDGYVKGFVLSGEYDEDSVPLKILVEWKNWKGDSTYREFLEETLTTDGFDVSAGNEQSIETSASPEAETDGE